jgi:hypothetical protein
MTARRLLGVGATFVIVITATVQAQPSMVRDCYRSMMIWTLCVEVGQRLVYRRPHTDEACKVRLKVEKLLGKLGYCYGTKSEFGPNGRGLAGAVWHKCTAKRPWRTPNAYTSPKNVKKAAIPIEQKRGNAEEHHCLLVKNTEPKVFEMPRHRWIRRSGNRLPISQDRLIMIKLVNKCRIVQQRIKPQHPVFALACEQRDEHRVTGRHDGVRHERLTGRNVVRHIRVTDSQEVELLRRSVHQIRRGLI